MSKKENTNNGITLIALVITIIIMLILASVTIKVAVDGGLFSYAKKANEETVIANEKEQVAVSYASAKIKIKGNNDVSADDLQKELDKSLGLDKNRNSKVEIDDNGDGTLMVLFKESNHNYNVDNGIVTKEEIDMSTIAMFDIGENVAKKMWALAPDGYIQWGLYVNNLSIDAIKKYKGTPDLSKMTDENIVSWTDGYNAYKNNPGQFAGYIPEGTELCPIYMWFEENGTEEIRNIYGDSNLKEITNSSNEKKVKHGTIYWWSKSKNVYLNPDSSNMFTGLPYVKDLSGLKGMKANYVQNMKGILYAMPGNKRLKNFDAIAKWDISSVRDLSVALCGYENLENINALGNWNTSNVQDLSGIFGNPDGTATKLTDITPLKNWDVSNVTNMEYLFYGTEITNLDALKDWNVSNVTRMSCMFYGNNLKDASGINDWDITKVTGFNNMFAGQSVHPEFTKVKGTWDNGTFTPDSN